ncbi:hypothetical protein D3C86_1881940 [compost metagenome]
MLTCTLKDGLDWNRDKRIVYPFCDGRGNRCDNFAPGDRLDLPPNLRMPVE